MAIFTNLTRDLDFHGRWAVLRGETRPFEAVARRRVSQRSTWTTNGAAHQTEPGSNC
jgi:hypothetical protein